MGTKIIDWFEGRFISLFKTIQNWYKKLHDCIMNELMSKTEQIIICHASKLVDVAAANIRITNFQSQNIDCSY